MLRCLQYPWVFELEVPPVHSKAVRAAAAVPVAARALASCRRESTWSVGTKRHVCCHFSSLMCCHTLIVMDLLVLLVWLLLVIV